MATDGITRLDTGLNTPVDEPQTRRTSVQSLDRAVALLDAVAEAGPHGIALSALAQQIRLPASTARTLLASLAAHGLVTQTTRERRYLLGARFFELNRRFTSQADLSIVAAPVMRSLWERTEETVHLAVLHGSRRVDIAVLVGPQLLTIDPTTARFDQTHRTPLYRTAAGKVLFAGLPPSDRLSTWNAADWHDEDPPAQGPLMSQMESIVEAGFATNIEEEATGVCGVAAPVLDQSGATVASICIGYPAVRYSEDYAESLREEVIAAGAELTALLGAETR